MEKKITFQLVTQEKTVLSEEVDSLTCPTQMGQITILPGHVPLISALQHGELIAKVDGKPSYIAVHGGFVEVRPGNKVIVLADMAEHAEQIDIQAAEEAKLRAQELMKTHAAVGTGTEEYARARAAFERNLTRVRVGTKRKPRHSGISSQGIYKE